MKQVRNIIQSKGNIIFSVNPHTTVYEALELMCEKNISSVLIMDGDKPLGIFTERDYARKVALKGKASKETLISDVMTHNLITVNPDCSIEEAMRIMTDKHIRHLPVTEGEKLTGLISIGDVVKYLIEEQKFIIGSLEQYISHT